MVKNITDGWTTELTHYWDRENCPPANSTTNDCNHHAVPLFSQTQLTTAAAFLVKLAVWNDVVLWCSWAFCMDFFWKFFSCSVSALMPQSLCEAAGRQIYKGKIHNCETNPVKRKWINATVYSSKTHKKSIIGRCDLHILLIHYTGFLFSHTFLNFIIFLYRWIFQTKHTHTGMRTHSPILARVFSPLMPPSESAAVDVSSGQTS